MKNTAIVLLSIAFSSPCLAGEGAASREVLLDNEAVEVVRLSYPAGSESGMHSHRYPNRVAYVVSGGKLEMVPGDSDEPGQSIEVAAGQAIYLPAQTHNVRNVGNTDIVIIEIEIK